jgi:hypothetical protein
MGYSFTSIEISEGESQTFQFNDGMPGGYENISISVRYGPPASLWGRVQVLILLIVNQLLLV